MYLVMALLAVVVIGLGFLAFQGRLGGMPPQVDDRPGPDLPPRALTGADLDNVRFAVVTRGYSMAQVDAVMARVAGQIDGKPFVPTDDYAEWAGTAAPAGTGIAAVDGGADAPAPVEPPSELVWPDGEGPDEATADEPVGEPSPEVSGDEAVEEPSGQVAEDEPAAEPSGEAPGDEPVEVPSGEAIEDEPVGEQSDEVTQDEPATERSDEVTQDEPAAEQSAGDHVAARFADDAPEPPAADVPGTADEQPAPRSAPLG